MKVKYAGRRRNLQFWLKRNSCWEKGKRIEKAKERKTLEEFLEL